jgi:hypothetical protein
VARTLEPIARLLAVSALVVAAAGCGGGDTVVNLDPAAPTLDPPQLSISGHWSTTTTEVRDTCGFDPPPVTSPLHIEDAGDSALFAYADPSGFCESSVRSREGDVVRLSRSDVIEACGGTVLVRSEITYVFDGETFTGSADHSYSNLTAQCGNLPCEYGLRVGGTRCAGCWPGCVEAAATAAIDHAPAPARLAARGGL